MLRRHALLLVVAAALLIAGSSAALAWTYSSSTTCLEITPSGRATTIYGPFHNLTDARGYAASPTRGRHGDLIPEVGTQRFEPCS